MNAPPDVNHAGSSPRARGTRRAGIRRGLRTRFIPGCAGNTSSAFVQDLPTAVHPSVRGEHANKENLPDNGAGSSPRARGTLCGRPPPHLMRRFIPACAGNTLWSAAAAFNATVHPRVRGEHRQEAPGARSIGGSSPRARGTRDQGNRGMGARRFIPACAGNTRSGAAHVGHAPVHPRVRGEHIGPIGPGRAADGSSPRARGTPTLTARISRSRRFIPACAGNTPPLTGRASGDTVHPRVRGEHNLEVAPLGIRGGSSPRARGTRRCRVRAPRPRRFIPACAGNTDHFLA